MGYIYKITNDVNGKIYVGQTIRTVDLRWKQHIKDSKREDGHCRHLYNAMNKYGLEHFKAEEIEECEDSKLDEREIYWIKYYNSYDQGYNLTIGGNGSQRNDYEKIYNCFLEGMTSKDIQMKFGCCAGTVREALIIFGVSEEERKQRSKKHAMKPVAKIDKDTDEILEIYPSVAKAALSTGEKNAAAHIARVCRGVRKSTCGYKWSYLFNLKEDKDNG